jgi:hypothetical protein
MAHNQCAVATGDWQALLFYGHSARRRGLSRCRVKLFCLIRQVVVRTIRGRAHEQLSEAKELDVLKQVTMQQRYFPGVAAAFLRSASKASQTSRMPMVASRKIPPSLSVTSELGIRPR